MHSQFSTFISDLPGGWHGAETSFCWFPGVYQDLRTQYPAAKMKYCASNDLLMEQSHASQSAWASQVAILAKSRSCILHKPPPPAFPSSECGSLLVASVSGKCVCVCDSAGLGQGPFAFKAYRRVVVSYERCRKQIFVGFYASSIIHFRFICKV